MSGNNVLNPSDTENTCVVCFKIMDIFSVGVCDHPVCFECSTRMRVLCTQKECPICRREMPMVIFTKEIKPYTSLSSESERQNLFERKYGLHFCTPAIQRRYYRLLEHECFICRRNPGSGPFKTFFNLKDHMRRVHELYCCGLCVSNLKIFTFERKWYTRVELATHRRKGDADNTSHRGHPLCEFCEERFIDNDELYRHLRRDHMYCHFCDLDGKHQYYNEYDDLRKHYTEEHYLCEEGECQFEKFTSVFRTDIDLKAHYAAVHSRNLSKAATRQARILELEFTLAPRARPEGSGRGRNYGRHPERQNEEEEGAVGYDTYYVEPGGNGVVENNVFSNPLAAENFPSLSGDGSNVSRTVSNVTITSKVNPLSEENFPSLGGSAPPRSSAVTITTSSGKFNPRSTEEFPSLGGSSSRQPAVTITRTVRGGQQGLQRNSANFPSLKESKASGGSVRLSVNNQQDHRPSSSMNKTPNVSIYVNHKPNGAITTRISQTTNGQTVSIRPKSTEDFPALGSRASVPQPQWVPQKTRKQEPKASKVAPAPALPPSGLSDFPSLSKSASKKSSVTMPVSNVWVNLNSFNSDVRSMENNTETPSDASRNQKQEKNKDKNAKGSNKASDPSENKNKKKKKGKSNNAVDELANSINKTKLEATAAEPSVERTPSTSQVHNGITKKRSELNLEVREPNIEATTSKPPPGFNLKPPPGLNNLNLANDLTFTSSSGQSYSIIPTQQFCPPANFKLRNQKLIEKFMAVLRNSEAIQQFKVYSDMFRVGEIPAENYYKHCQNFMGSEFENIFPELLVLLPNIQRQQDLYKVHKSSNACKGLEMCATCKQVVLNSDLRGHLSNHVLDNHFPVLAQPSEENNFWNKK